MPLPSGFPPVDFEDFHRRQLPELIAAGRGALAARAAQHLDRIALSVNGAAFTYRPQPGSIEIVAGDDGSDTVLELDLESWQGLVHELEAPAGLLYGGRVRCRRGNAVDLMAWETALRALYHGREPYDPA